MPRFNQSGPMGQGAMTGRQMGKCTNFGANRKTTITETKSNAKNTTGDEQEFGRGMSCRRGGGRRMCHQNNN